MTEAREVPAVEVVRTQAESSEQVGALPAEEEEGDGTVFDKLVTSAKLTQGLVEVGPFLSLYVADLLLMLLLTAIISHFDHQLLGNKISFTPCSIHILLISNKFHKFWMSCGCRN